MNNEEYKNTQPQRLESLVLWILVIGAFVILLYSISCGVLAESFSWKKFGQVLSIELAVAGSALAMGGLLGFLFGIPRSRMRLGTDSEGQPSENLSTTQSNPRYGDNDSLEQISDWLTKILLGAGLAQISSVSGALNLLSTTIVKSISSDNYDSSGLFGVSVFIVYIVSGFVGGYLWARFSIRTELTRRDQEIGNIRKEIRREVDEVQNKIEETKKQTDYNSQILSELYEYLEPSAPIIYPDQAESIVTRFKESFSNISDSVRLDIFRQLRTIRSENWKNNKRRMAQTICFFEALIESEKKKSVLGNNYHRLLAEIGFALKDKEPPDYVEAKKYLKKAIEERDKNMGEIDFTERPWLAYYEFNYLYCVFGLKKQDQEPNIKEKLTIVKEANILQQVISDKNNRDPIKEMNTWINNNNFDLS